MKALHGPFDPVSKGRRGDVRERIEDGVRMGTCSCDICDRRRSRGKDPYGLPKQKLWTRLPSLQGHPGSQRQVFLCEGAGFTSSTSNGSGGR